MGGIFITVILVIAASVIFLSIHHFLSPEQESSASQIIDEQRKEKSLSMPKKVKILPRKLTATISRTIHQSNPP